MNKKLLSLLVSGSLIAVVSTSVFATDTGVVNFNGKIVADTCEINVNESASTTGTVTLQILTQRTILETVVLERQKILKLN